MEWIEAKSLLQRVSYDPAFWFGMDYTVNAYRGCCHGCIYCDSRSERYRINHFDTVRGKIGFDDLFPRELSRQKRGFVGMGAMSDPYNPLEKKYLLTQKALKAIQKANFAVGVTTKSPLVVRDTAIYQQLSSGLGAVIKMTITCAEDNDSRRFEPHVAPSSDRFAALEKLSAAGVCTGVLILPVLPFLTDKAENILKIIDRAADAGAAFVYMQPGMTLRDRQAIHYMERIAEIDSGLPKRYAQEFGRSYQCSSPAAQELLMLQQERCQERGLRSKMEDIVPLYKKTEKKPKQRKLFE